MVNLHCEIDSIVSPIVTLTVGDIPKPIFTENTSQSQQFEDFRLSPDGNQYIARTGSDDWFLSSLNNNAQIKSVAEDAFFAQWNPTSESEVAFVKNTLVNILPNLQGITSKSLISKDLSSTDQKTLHEITNLHDFDNDKHSPEQYWIHEFHYSYDGTFIYFISNKENGSNTRQEKLVYNNIWKLDLVSGNIEALTDFLPTQFELKDFVEDPKRKGNFYLLGGEDKIDIYYFDSSTKKLEQIFDTPYTENNLSIDPLGENVLVVSDRSGTSELWNYNLASQEIKQITDNTNYTPSYRWHHLNWIPDNEFMVYVKHQSVFKFATFKLD